MATAISPASNASLTAPTIWHSVDDIDTIAWETVRDANDLFMDLRLLRVVQRSMSTQARFRYVLFYDDLGQPAAITCLCTYVIDGTLLVAEGRMKKLLGLVGRILPLVVKYKVLFCGMPFSAGQSHLRFAEGADRPAILADLCCIMDEVAQTDRARVIVLKEFDNDDRHTMDDVEQHGYRRADSLPMNLTAPQQTSFDDYLTAQKHRTRHNIRRSLKRLAEGGLHILSTSDPDEIERIFTHDVHNLYTAIFQHSETKLEYLPIEFFREIPRQLPKNCRFFFLIEGDTVRAFGASVFSDRSYHPLFAGIDYEKNADFDLYFNVLYATFADALSQGADQIHMGQDADFFKQSKLGCHQEARSFYVKGVRPPIRLALRMLFEKLFPARPLTAPREAS